MMLKFSVYINSRLYISFSDFWKKKHLFYNTSSESESESKLWSKLWHHGEQNLKLCSAQVQILLQACWRFAMMKILSSSSSWKWGLIPFIGLPFHKNNSPLTIILLESKSKSAKSSVMNLFIVSSLSLYYNISKNVWE